MLDSWPALRLWRDPRYLHRIAGPRTVPVEVGDHYLAEGWGQRLVRFGDFLDKHVLGRDNPALKDHEESTLEGRAYLAQHPLLDQIPDLAADISTPEYCVLGEEGEVNAVNAWIGPAGTVSPLHTDPHHNLLCQVAGRKYLRLYSPEQKGAMRPPGSGMTANTSTVDLDDPPKAGEEGGAEFAAAPFLECQLDEGEALYLPPGWWHYVKSLSPSISVSFWWS
jgi:[histone H3]-dimethyl/trimethyl-L-lysine36 demethylase